MKRKGLTTVQLVAIIAAIAVAAFAVYASVSASVTDEDEVDYDGSFTQIQTIQELGGYNYLDVTTETLNSSNAIVDDGNVVTSFNVNDSDGDELRFAAGFDLDGPVADLDVQLTNEGVVDNLDVTSAYIIQDEDDDLSLDSDEAIVREFTADSDDEFDQTVASLDEGEYAVVLNVKGVDTSGITTDQDLYTINMDAGEAEDDEDGSDSMEFTIDNAAS